MASFGWRNASIHSGSRVADADRLDAEGPGLLDGVGQVGHLEGEVVGPGAAGGEEPGQEVVDLDVPGHEDLDPGAVGEAELGRGESRPRAAGVPLRTEVGGVAVPGVLPAGYGVGDVVEDGALDPGPSGGCGRHPHRLVATHGRCRHGGVAPVRSAHGLPHVLGGRPGAQVRSGSLTATELVDHALGRIADLNPTVNAFVAVDESTGPGGRGRRRRHGGVGSAIRARWPASPSG